ncbi:MAG: hypothetical protein ACREQQ_05040 [Candidatus Binatia bacterium]
MLPYKLKILDAGSVHSLPPDPISPDLEVWRDPQDRVAAYGYVAERRYWMHFPDLASFCFSKEAAEITAFPRSAGRDAIVRDVYRRSVLPMVMQVRGCEALHASAVVADHGSVAFCGASGAGKSTIAYGLALRGYAQWADDSVVIERVGGEIRALALPFAARLRSDSERYFAEARPAAARRRSAARRAASVPLTALFVLERAPVDGGAGRVDVRRLRAAELFTAVLPHAYCFSLADPARKRRMIRHYLELGSRVPAFRMRFSPDLGSLASMLDRIERLIAED